MTELIELKDLPTKCPEGQFSPWVTGHIIRKKKLGCVRVGKRIFVTQRLLEQFIKDSSEPAVGAKR